MNPTDHILSCFEQLSSVPRGSKNEAGIRSWLQDWACSQGLTSKTDAAGNLVIQVPASVGYENRPILILQGHLDMVCQKTPDSDHDFLRDPIRLIRDGDWIHADKTSLGADNGIAIALMMAVVEDKTISHPPLELLLTVEEELGMIGADNLDLGMISGKTLINLDSEKEGELIVGCAGGGSVDITLPVNWSPQTSQETAFELKIGGLQGGHSGGDIIKHRTNANKLMGRVLDFIQREISIRLATLKGGSARNAIPRDAEAIFVLAKESSGLCLQKFSILLQTIEAEHKLTEPGLWMTLVEKGGETIEAIRHVETVTAIRLLVALPDGVAAMSAEIPGNIETSNNIGIMELKKEGLWIISHHRSSILSRLEESTRRVEALAWLAGAKTERTKISHPWDPNLDSLLLKNCVQIYESIFHSKPKVKIIHGGLECGRLSERFGGLDTISLGPTIESPHSPVEGIYVPSIVKIWEFLRAILGQ